MTDELRTILTALIILDGIIVALGIVVYMWVWAIGKKIGIN
jgi:hypothetical protein